MLGERKRQISGQKAGRAVMRERHRVVRLGKTEIALDIGREAEGISVRFVDEKGNAAAPRVLTSEWRPGDPVWSGVILDQSVAVQVRPVANGFVLAHRGVETRAFVYTELEAAMARLMPVKQAADTGKLLLCPMPGLVGLIAVAARPGRSRPARRWPWSRP